jgi:serine/threonine protein kinase
MKSNDQFADKPNFPAKRMNVVELQNAKTVVGSIPEVGLPLKPKSGKEPTSQSFSFGLKLKGRFTYELQCKLGKGGMGSVYLARCLDVSEANLSGSPPRKVAIKLFNPPSGLDKVALLKRELSSLLALNHPRIPCAFDWDVTGKLAFVVLEYFPQGSLGDHLAEHGPLQESSAWLLLCDLLSALSAAHLASIVHLDIKPDNVLLEKEGRFVLTDFGISQGSMVSRYAVMPGLGAHGYRSPEQRRADHESFDSRTDLWGVGITMWSALTGIPLSTHTDLMLPATSFYGMPGISESGGKCSSRLEAMVMGLLANERDNRPGSAAEVLDHVKNILAGTSEFSPEIFAKPISNASPEQIEQLLDSLMDPLWFDLCRKPEIRRFIFRYEDGALLCNEGEKSFRTYVLLKGVISVERQQKQINIETREGTFLGEVNTLTGFARTATLRAAGPIWVCVFNAAELEDFVAKNPPVGLRLIKSLAERVVRESEIKPGLE